MVFADLDGSKQLAQSGAIHLDLAADSTPIVGYQTEPKEKPAVNDLVRSYESCEAYIW